eukprot:scaffold3241_cov125-Cylindrotheca_fusiformis.AAC.6
MRQVERFVNVLLEEDGVTESNNRQLAIDIDNPAPGPRGSMFGLNNFLGKVACKIETMLLATFYARPGSVTWFRSTVMQFGTIGSDGDFTLSASCVVLKIPHVLKESSTLLKERY